MSIKIDTGDKLNVSGLFGFLGELISKGMHKADVTIDVAGKAVRVVGAMVHIDEDNTLTLRLSSEEDLEIRTDKPLAYYVGEDHMIGDIVYLDKPGEKESEGDTING